MGNADVATSNPRAARRLRSHEPDCSMNDADGSLWPSADVTAVKFIGMRNHHEVNRRSRQLRFREPSLPSRRQGGSLRAVRCNRRFATHAAPGGASIFPLVRRSNPVVRAYHRRDCFASGSRPRSYRLLNDCPAPARRDLDGSGAGSHPKGRGQENDPEYLRQSRVFRWL
jgi:hypothetical protein